MINIKSCFVLLATLSGSLAQTRVDLGNQGKHVDFTAAAITKPVRTGSSLPASCETGEMYFLVGAQNAQLYGCIASGNWLGLAYQLPSQSSKSGNVLVSDGTSENWVLLSGDLVSSVTTPGTITVRAVQNHPVSANTPQTGNALVWNGSFWIPQMITVGQGALSLETNGTVVGTRNTQNYVSGTGIISAITDTGQKLNLQQSVDTAFVETKSDAQAGTTLNCTSGSGSASSYTCTTQPTLSGYTTGMLLHWWPDVSAAGGAITLNVDQLGAKLVKLADGISNPVNGDVEAGKLYQIWYDGANFRLASNVNLNTASTRPSCDSSTRARLWFQLGASGAKDSVALCVKDASNSYQWQVLY